MYSLDGESDIIWQRPNIAAENGSAPATELYAVANGAKASERPDGITDGGQQTESRNSSVISANYLQDGSSQDRLEKLLASRNVPHPTSNMDTLMHILKGNIGTGILAIPSSFKSSGITVGMVGLILIALVCIHCMNMVLKCARVLCLRAGRSSLDFATSSSLAFELGPRICRRYAKVVRFLTNFFLCVSQLGFCCVYFIFVSTNIKQIVDEENGRYLDYRIYASIILVPIILTNLLRNLKFLVPLSIGANVLQVIALGIIFYYVCQDIPSINTRKQFSNIAELPIWFGTVIYAFEGIGLVLPLENNMKTPLDYGGLTGVLNTGMSLVTCSFLAVGFYGYLKYGDDIQGSITLNLPPGIPSILACSFYAFATFLSYAIQFYVPILIMWPTLERRCPPKYRYIGEVGFRIFFVLVTFGLAVLIPQLNLFISLVGSFSGSYLSLIIPPLMELATFWNYGISRLTIFKDLVILVVGVIGCVTGTYTSIYDIITTFTT